MLQSQHKCSLRENKPAPLEVCLPRGALNKVVMRNTTPHEEANSLLFSWPLGTGCVLAKHGPGRSRVNYMSKEVWLSSMDGQSGSKEA